MSTFTQNAKAYIDAIHTNGCRFQLIYDFATSQANLGYYDGNAWNIDKLLTVKNSIALTKYDDSKTLVECLNEILIDSNFEELIARDIQIYCSAGTYYGRATKVNAYSMMGFVIPDSENSNKSSYSLSRRYYNNQDAVLIALN